ncbi:MAG TPA: hypothetical protein VHB20_00505 [Verrucomicrobiae bacterium]|nr:hypothetical protein [Verrucomicrobiae bacterium]
MKTKHSPHGRISDHFEGLGAASSDTVVQRAREIAIINGRPPNHFSKDDFLEAKRELTGAESYEDGEFEEAVARLTKWDDAPASHGHSSQKSEAPDEQSVAEELVEEGMNEAEHEQMVEGAKSHRG